MAPNGLFRSLFHPMFFFWKKLHISAKYVAETWLFFGISVSDEWPIR